MALRYDYRNIKSIKDNISEKESDQLGMFAWQMMAIDIQEVTEQNVNEVCFRLLFLQKLGFGALSTPEGKALNKDTFNSHDHELDPSELRKYIRSLIGYKTNVLTLTRGKFMRRWMKAFERDIDESLLTSTKIPRELSRGIQTPRSKTSR